MVLLLVGKRQSCAPGPRCPQQSLRNLAYGGKGRRPPRPQCLMHEALAPARRWPRRGATHLTRGGPSPPLTKTVALPPSPPAMAPPAAILPAYAAASARTAVPSGITPVST